MNCLLVYTISGLYDESSYSGLLCHSIWYDSAYCLSFCPDIELFVRCVFLISNFLSYRKKKELGIGNSRKQVRLDLSKYEASAKSKTLHRSPKKPISEIDAAMHYIDFQQENWYLVVFVPYF